MADTVSGIVDNLELINEGILKSLTGIIQSIDSSIGSLRGLRIETDTRKISFNLGEEAGHIDFDVIDNVVGEATSLNGNTRNQTDAAIRRIFGTVDDFGLTSMSSQFGALRFIDEGSTRRKEILAKFLDLELFEKKYKCKINY